MISLTVRVKVYLIFLLLRRESEVVFVWIVKKKRFSWPDFVDSEN